MSTSTSTSVPVTPLAPVPDVVDPAVVAPVSVLVTPLAPVLAPAMRPASVPYLCLGDGTPEHLLERVAFPNNVPCVDRAEYDRVLANIDPAQPPRVMDVSDVVRALKGMKGSPPPIEYERDAAREAHNAACAALIAARKERKEHVRSHNLHQLKIAVRQTRTLLNSLERSVTTVQKINEPVGPHRTAARKKTMSLAFRAQDVPAIGLCVADVLGVHGPAHGTNVSELVMDYAYGPPSASGDLAWYRDKYLENLKQTLRHPQPLQLAPMVGVLTQSPGPWSELTHVETEAWSGLVTAVHGAVQWQYESVSSYTTMPETVGYSYETLLSRYKLVLTVRGKVVHTMGFSLYANKQGNDKNDPGIEGHGYGNSTYVFETGTRPMRISELSSSHRSYTHRAKEFAIKLVYALKLEEAVPSWQDRQDVMFSFFLLLGRSLFDWKQWVPEEVPCDHKRGCCHTRQWSHDA